MKKWLPSRLTATAILLTLNSAQAQKAELLQYKFLPDYSSASAIAWHKGKLYVMGDDAPTLLIVNRRLKEKKQVPVFNYKTKRIPYAEKPDLEAAAIIRMNGKNSLLLFPSFSNAIRNKAVLYELGNRKAQPKIVNWSLSFNGLMQTNIEGAEMFEGDLLLANRANIQAPTHFLLRYSFDGNTLSAKPEKTYTIQLPATPNIVGISGMTYVAKKDMLLLTVSTEITRSATADGAIGDSYLAIVQNAGKQLASGNSIKADAIINLAKVLNTKEPQKIESIAVSKVRRKRMVVYLAADNDNGTTHLFRISLMPGR